MDITTLQNYIDIYWDKYAYAMNPTVTDYDVKLKILTSINDISYTTILQNYGDNSTYFLSRYLDGNIIASRYKESTYSYYYGINVDLGIELGSPDINIDQVSNVNAYQGLTDHQIPINIDTTYDGIRLLK
jgi:hypothetical protein